MAEFSRTFTCRCCGFEMVLTREPLLALDDEDWTHMQWRCEVCDSWEDWPADFEPCQLWPKPPRRPKDLVIDAYNHLRTARDLLKQAGATRTLARVRSALKSADGAIRHAGTKSAST